MASVSGQRSESHHFESGGGSYGFGEYGHTGGKQNRGNVGRVYQGSMNGAKVKLEAGAGGHNYVMQGSVNNSEIVIQGAGGDNFIFQGSVENSSIGIEGSGHSNVIFQGSLRNSNVRIYSAGGDVIIFQGAVRESSIKDRGQNEESRFMFSGPVVDSEVVYREAPSRRK